MLAHQIKNETGYNAVITIYVLENNKFTYLDGKYKNPRIINIDINNEDIILFETVDSLIEHVKIEDKKYDDYIKKQWSYRYNHYMID